MTSTPSDGSRSTPVSLGARLRARWHILPTGLLAGLAIVAFQVAVVRVNATGFIGNDLAVMTELGRRWLATGSMYLAYQLAGPFSVAMTPDLAATPGLYPPAAGPLFGIMSLIPDPLLVALWWGIPAAMLSWSFLRWRPAGWTWPLIVLCFVWPISWMAVLAGSTAMWGAAIVALGLVWGWPAAVLLVKPTLAPFALVGIRSRAWWVVAGVIVVLTLAGPWRDYLAVFANAQGLEYAWYTYPLLLVPLIAWLGRTRPLDEEHALAVLLRRAKALRARSGA